MPTLYPPFIPVFGTGVPGGTVPHSTLYYDTSTNPYTAYVFHAGAWHTAGALGSGGNATFIDGIAVDLTGLANGDTLIYSAGLNEFQAGAGSGGGSDPSIAPLLAALALQGFDPLFANGCATLSNNNRTATPTSGSPYNHMFGGPAQYTGKRYYEFVPGSTSFTVCGIAGSYGHFRDLGDSSNTFSTYAGQVGWLAGGAMQVTGTAKTGDNQKTLATIDTWTTGNSLCFAVDLDARLLWCRVNGGNWNGNVLNNPATGVGGIDLTALLNGAGNTLYWPGMSAGNTSAHELFTATGDFLQAVPVGFISWSGI